MSLIDRVKKRVPTDLDDVELQLMVDEALEAIINRWGPNPDPAHPITMTVIGWGAIIDVGRPIDTSQPIVIVETVPWDWWWGGITTVTLTSSDYAIRHNGRTLERLSTGPNPNYRRAWGRQVTITYTPVSDANARQEAVIKLVMLGVQYQGLNSSSIGDVNQSYLSYAQEREQILASLVPRKLFVR
jgi:hypothetical protein